MTKKRRDPKAQEKFYASTGKPSKKQLEAKRKRKAAKKRNKTKK